jgi:hypothetical protein
VGEWSAGLGSKTLEDMHYRHVAEVLSKAKKPKNKQEAVALAHEAQLSAPQKLMVWYEASLHGPLTQEAYEEYMSLFSQVVGPDQYKRLFGESPPKQSADSKRMAERLYRQMFKFR